MTLAQRPGIDGVSADAPPADSEWRRLSGRMLLVHPVRELGRNIPTLVVLLVAGHSRGGNGEWWSVAGVAVVIATSIARWFTTRYRITPEQVQLRKGLIRRQTVTTPADRVRSVDVSASALHRVLGLAKVEIGTGVSDTKKEGLTLDGLSAASATGLRSELLHRGAASRPHDADVQPGVQPDSDADSDSDPDLEQDVETELVRLQPSWIAYAPFTFSGILTALAVAGVGWRLLSEANLDLTRTAAFREAAGRVDTTPLWVTAAVVLAVVLVGIAVLSLVAYVLAFWGFRLTRHSRGTLHVQRGLVTTRSISIEERRLRGVEVSEPLLLRAVHGARLIAITTGLRVGRGAQRGGSMIVPPAPRAEVSRVAGDILHLVPARGGEWPAPELDLIDGSLTSHGPTARRRRRVRALVPALLLLAGGAYLVTRGWSSWVLGLPVALLVSAPLLAGDRYRALGHRGVDGYLVTRFGSLVRRRSIIATDGIIGWNIDASFFQRRAGLVTLAATTAAGDQAYCIWDVPAAEALRVAEAAVPGLLGQFLTAAAAPDPRQGHP